jgi:hypothetical protein
VPPLQPVSGSFSVFHDYLVVTIQHPSELSDGL